VGLGAAPPERAASELRRWSAAPWESSPLPQARPGQASGAAREATGPTPGPGPAAAEGHAGLAQLRGGGQQAAERQGARGGRAGEPQPPGHGGPLPCWRRCGSGVRWAAARRKGGLAGLGPPPAALAAHRPARQVGWLGCRRFIVGRRGGLQLLAGRNGTGGWKADIIWWCSRIWSTCWGSTLPGKCKCNQPRVRLHGTVCTSSYCISVHIVRVPTPACISPCVRVLQTLMH
jgi:hypothetical protein